MKKNENFILFESFVEFGEWLAEQDIKREVTCIQNHHTWKPNYDSFNGRNHFELQQSMKNYHTLPKEKGGRGWSDIGQHLTTFPDGSIITGRSFNRTPAGIKGKNRGAIMIEHLGDFDKGKDVMTKVHAANIVLLNAILCKSFGLKPSTSTILYHNWFASWKSCPGTNFFKGNTKEAATRHFIPIVKDTLKNM